MPPSALESVQSLYRLVPDVGCKGLCTQSCGPILYSVAEGSSIARKHGARPVPSNGGTCSSLRDGKCSVYADRPMICRLYGAVASMRCQWGCAPALSEAQSAELLGRSVQAGGGVDPHAERAVRRYLNAKSSDLIQLGESPLVIDRGRLAMRVKRGGS